MLKVIYAFFLGILLSIFVGVGITAFCKTPQPPKAPDYSLIGKDGPSAAQQAEENRYQKAFDDYNKHKLNPYNRNVSIIALAAAIIFVAVGLLLGHRIDVLADGVVLGGVFTLIYSLGRGFAAEDSRYSFVAVTISLLIALLLGYLRFIRPAGGARHAH